MTYFFHINEEESYVGIVSKEFWEENGCLDDQHLTEELEQQNLMHPNLFEVCESTFEYEGDLVTLQNELLGMGYQQDPSFSAYMS